MGTKTILELCLKHDLKKVVILSTFHVYGALSDNSVFLDEDSPLRASLQYADMRDVVEMDQICTNWMWKNQNDINTIILRPSNIIGPNIHNAISNFLTANTNIYPLDFNPIFQFIYEWDMIRILFRTLGHFETGVYNVATDDTISLRDTLKLTSARNIPISLFALQYLNRTFQRLTHIPEYLFDYLKYSCLISNDNIKRHLETDFFKYKAEQSLKMLGR
jgi:UDP-glucose 4-epimerase